MESGESKTIEYTTEFRNILSENRRCKCSENGDILETVSREHRGSGKLEQS